MKDKAWSKVKVKWWWRRVYICVYITSSCVAQKREIEEGILLALSSSFSLHTSSIASSASSIIINIQSAIKQRLRSPVGQTVTTILNSSQSGARPGVTSFSPRSIFLDTSKSARAQSKARACARIIYYMSDIYMYIFYIYHQIGTWWDDIWAWQSFFCCFIQMVPKEGRIRMSAAAF